MRRYAAVILTSLLLAGCAPPLESGRMLPKTSVYSKLPRYSYLSHSIALGQARVADGAGSGSVPVTQGNFREALNTVLLSSGLGVRGGQPARYRLDAELLELDQPLIGLSLTVTARVHYRLMTTRQEDVVFEDTIVMPYTADFSDAINFENRMRMASGGALSENFTHLVRVLAEKRKSDL